MATTHNGPASEQKRGFEFGALENQAFTRLALTMQLVATAQIAGAIIAAVVKLPHGLDALTRGAYRQALIAAAWVLVPAFIGGWTFRAGSHLRLIVRTQGDDISHLMAAVGELTKLYVLQLGVLLVGVALAATLTVG